MFTHNIYRNIRVRVILLHRGKMLLHPPAEDRLGRDPYRVPPGGGLDPNETLYEAGEREVFEETGLRVKVRSVAFLREWVVPKHVPADDMRALLEAQGIPPEETRQADHAYGLEVYLWAELPHGETAAPKRGDRRGGVVADWVPVEQVEHEPVFPTELKALARDLAEGRPPVGVPSFATGFGTPWDEPDYDAFRTAMSSGA
jgi:8-oxo-dGTP pyrophosphatase MutT (NUDIX family)